MQHAPRDQSTRSWMTGSAAQPWAQHHMRALNHYILRPSSSARYFFAGARRPPVLPVAFAVRYESACSGQCAPHNFRVCRPDRTPCAGSPATCCIVLTPPGTLTKRLHKRCLRLWWMRWQRRHSYTSLTGTASTPSSTARWCVRVPCGAMQHALQAVHCCGHAVHLRGCSRLAGDASRRMCCAWRNQSDQVHACARARGRALLPPDQRIQGFIGLPSGS